MVSPPERHPRGLFHHILKNCFTGCTTYKIRLKAVNLEQKLKRMRKLLATTLLFAGSLLAVSGQVISEAEMNELLKSQNIKLENPIIRDFVIMSQIQEDIAPVNPHSGLSVQILQNGNRNSGIIEQVGYGLDTYLSQDGSFNEANLMSEGNNILTEVKQEGDGNIIDSYIKNYHLESRTARLLQVGNDNNITLNLREADVPESIEAQEIKITQHGNEHKATVTGVDFNSPITINQTAGYGGMGMQIEINTSYFFFP
jgi:hypothetical protein